MSIYDLFFRKRNSFKGSLSNNGIYPDFCMKASMSDQIFSEFRKNPIYNQILEHTTKYQGELYIERINELDNKLLSDDNINIFKKNDGVGGAVLEDFSLVKQISPSTLRYVSVLAEIKKVFGSLDNKNVCEIGVGYGGQARILTSFFDIKKYTLVDLYPVTRLAQKYLDNFCIKSVLEYKTMNELPYDSEYDFVISNYAFSELTREVQDIYLEKLIKNSKSGYMIINKINPDEFNSYSVSDLLNVIPNNPVVLDEIPKTYEGNVVIVWGINT